LAVTVRGRVKMTGKMYRATMLSTNFEAVSSRLVGKGSKSFVTNGMPPT
jgi:hypothetical protein